VAARARVVTGAPRLPRTEEVKGTGRSGVSGAAAVFLILRVWLADDESRGGRLQACDGGAPSAPSASMVAVAVGIKGEWRQVARNWLGNVPREPFGCLCS
jgi:hypothetical protein